MNTSNSGREILIFRSDKYNVSDQIDFNHPPDGYRYVPVMIESGMIQEWGLDPGFITTRYIGNRNHLVYMQLWTDEEAKWYIQDLKNEQHWEDRSGRCVITSPKTGKPILCPEERSCTGCPFNGAMKQEQGSTLSLEQMLDMGYEPETHASIEDDFIAEELKLEILATLSSRDRKLTDIFERLVAGMAPKEIGEELGISRSTLYDDIEKIRETIKKHMNP